MYTDDPMLFRNMENVKTVFACAAFNRLRQRSTEEKKYLNIFRMYYTVVCRAGYYGSVRISFSQMFTFVKAVSMRPMRPIVNWKISITKTNPLFPDQFAVCVCVCVVQISKTNSTNENA